MDKPKMKEQDATLQERISFLQNLHRPLEEHWSHAVSQGLSARTSDYMYKHHITHLEDIYTNSKSGSPSSNHNMLMSPVTQLYGVHGLKSNLPKQKEKEREKEGKWVSNFHVYSSLNQSKKAERIRNRSLKTSNDYDAQSVQRSSSREQMGLTSPLDMTDEEQTEENKSLSRRRTRNEGLSAEELVLLGMYKFTAEQEEIYQKFVEMLSGFDNFDMKSILEDAYDEAQLDNILEDFGGVEQVDASKHKH